MYKEKRGQNIKIKDSTKAFSYIMLMLFILSFVIISYIQSKEVLAETIYNHPKTTNFKTTDYEKGDGAQLNKSDKARFTKNFHSYRVKDMTGNQLMIRKIINSSGENKAVYCIDRTTEFPGTNPMKYHFNGTLEGNQLTIPQYTYQGDLKNHTITGDRLGQLRWLVDQFYLRETGSIESKRAIKKNLYEGAAKYKFEKDGKRPTYNEIKEASTKYYNLMNDSDMESVQQWALWEIANEGIDKTKYQPYTGGELYYKINENANIQTEKIHMAARVDVFNYLYHTAKTKNAGYKNEVTPPEISGRLKSEQVTKEVSGLDTTGIINYGYRIAIPGESQNKSAITSVKLYDAAGKEINPSEFRVGLYSGEKPTKEEINISQKGNMELQDAVGEGNFFIYFPDGSKYFGKNEKFILKAKYRQITTYPYVYLPDKETAKQGDMMTQAVVMLDRSEKEDEKALEVEAPKGYDLALRKSIVKVHSPITGESKDYSERIPKVDSSNLKATSKEATKEQMTAKYMHPKDPVNVEHGDIITYEFNIYNEDDQDKTLKQIKDVLPKGLKMVPVEKSNINKKYGWTQDSSGRILTSTIPDGGVKLKGTTPDGNGSKINGNYKIYLELYVEETAVPDKIYTNIAEITGDEPKTDRDSVPKNHFDDYFSKLTDDKLEKYKGNDTNKDDLGDKNYFYKGQEDDDDFEKVRVILKDSDLALRKFVNKVNNKVLSPSREPIVDVTPLKRGEFDAKYTQQDPKENKVPVKNGDLVEYIIRVYNEGEIDAYAAEISDLIPEGTEFLPDDETNMHYGWKKDPSNPNLIKTKYLAKTDDAKNLMKAFSKDQNNLDYRDIKVVVKVINASDPEKLINISEITEQTDKDGKPRKDRDSVPGNKNPNEDDIDYEHLKGQIFDLALRKFIVEIDKKVVDPSREPVVDTKPLIDGTNTTAIYTHPKNPLEVENKSIVRYKIRVYNEGDIDGYAKEVTDNLPKGLDFIKDSEINKKYGWVQDESNPKIIRTNYLSKKQGEIDKRDNLLKAFDKKTNKLDYRDLEIECIVNVKEDKKVSLIEGKQSNLLFGAEVEETSESNLRYKVIEKDEEYVGDINKEENKTEKNKETNEEDEVSITLIDTKKQEENKNSITNEFKEKTDIIKGKRSEESKTKSKSESESKNKGIKSIEKSELDVVSVEEENQLRNIAEITEDEDEFGNEIKDRDSDPSVKTYENKKEGDWEDDEDFEKLKLSEPKIFDLALIKLITSYNITQNGKTTTVDTKHTRETNNPEPVVKIDLNQDMVDKSDISYTYTIEIENQGNIDGYATEISDYIPKGLLFFKEDNPNWDLKDGKIVTRELEGKRLKPGERASVKLTLRWDKKEKFFGQMTNVAEISEDKNDYGIKDIDSTPNNKTPGEDDIDDATVLLSIRTGGAFTYFKIGMVTLVIIGGAVTVIKKHVMS